MPLPSEIDVEKALEGLVETDERFAQASARQVAAKEGLKVARAKAMPAVGTVAQREASALMSADYALALDELRTAEFEKTLMHLRRQNWQTQIDVWRSLNANQRRA